MRASSRDTVSPRNCRGNSSHGEGWASSPSTYLPASGFSRKSEKNKLRVEKNCVGRGPKNQRRKKSFFWEVRLKGRICNSQEGPGILRDKMVPWKVLERRTEHHHMVLQEEDSGCLCTVDCVCRGGGLRQGHQAEGF